jgi:ParB family transcriptional regulator, chromosome partitioning protein
MARTALGKGLGALIREPEILPASPNAPGAPPAPRLSPETAVQGMTPQLEIDLIDPNPYQPRTRFREETLEELARSIRAGGIIQPLVVRPNGLRYQLIAGERRWRAAQRAGLQRVPAMIREVPERMALEITLIENLQREDLSPIEQARAFERLSSDFQLTQEEIAERTGKDRATIANAVRLLRLEKPVQEMLDDGRLTAGHGRALLAIEDPKLRLVLAERAAKGRVTVRQIERLASRLKRKGPAPEAPKVDPNVRAALEELQRALGTKVMLRPRSGKRPGRLIIEYYEDSQLDGLYQRILGTNTA